MELFFWKCLISNDEHGMHNEMMFFSDMGENKSRLFRNYIFGNAGWIHGTS